MRKIAFLVCGPVLALALASAQAGAEPPGAAARFYAAGDFVAAASVAEAQTRSPQSLAFAARALMAACVTTNDRSQIEALLTRAESAAQDALELDNNSVEARLQLALALGIRARRSNIAEAMAHNYAPRGRELLLQALALAPDEPWAHALLGGWHLEVLRRGGRAGAAFYHARLSTGIAEFNRARALAPNDPMIALNYGVALLQYDPARYHGEARALLATAAESAPRDALEAHGLSSARRLLHTLDQDGPEAAARAARAEFP